MIRFIVLGSGSGGNVALVEGCGTRLLIDAGLSARQITSRLEAADVDPASLNGILLTHEHGDHTRGLRVFLKKHAIPLYTTPQTAYVVRQSGLEGVTWRHFESGQEFAIGGLTVRSFAIQHDAVDPVGFVFSTAQSRLGFLSDVGHVTASTLLALSEIDALFVEANYDDGLLDADLKRPWSIKQRISSRHGHLSNKQVAELVVGIAGQRLTRIVLGHLSSDCNHPDLATQCLCSALQAGGHGGIGIHCATQHEPTPWFQICPGVAAGGR